MARPLRQQLAIVTACLVLPLSAVILLTARLTLIEEREQLMGDAKSVAATVVAYINQQVRSASTVDAHALQPVVASIPLPDNSAITVTDEHGVVVARSQDPDRFVGQAIGAAKLLEKPTTGVHEGLDGVVRAFGTATSENGRYLVSVGIPTLVAYERVAPIYRRNLAWTGGMISTMLVIGLVVTRRWLKAVSSLEASAKRVAAGDLSDVATRAMPSREFEQLQASFASMVKRVRDAQIAVAAQVAEERRMREEVQSLQRQIIRQERLAAIGILVSGIAHELNNPLQAIYGFAELLNRRDDLPEEVRDDLALIEKESARSAAIIKNLSRFGRQQSSKPASVLAGDVVASVMELRRRKLEEANIDVVIEDRALARVLAVFTELQQVLLNFVINAEQSICSVDAAVRRIVIRTSEANGRVRLEVEDTGLGVDVENEPKLFQPFFSTKPVGEGTGLGLSVSYGIIEGYGGSVGYHRGAAGGAVFHFELPRYTDPNPQTTS